MTTTPYSSLTYDQRRQLDMLRADFVARMAGVLDTGMWYRMRAEAAIKCEGTGTVAVFAIKVREKTESTWGSVYFQNVDLEGVPLSNAREVIENEVRIITNRVIQEDHIDGNRYVHIAGEEISG